MGLDPLNQILLYAFIGAFALGAIANKTNFCTMGAVSDWINMGKTGRLWAWFTAIAVAILGVLALEAFAGVSVDKTLPPYRTANFAWLRYLLGGFLFGIGMTLAGGCGNKTMLNIGAGNTKSILVLGVTGYFAYLMTKTDFYGILFHSWISGTAIDLASHDINSQSLDAIGASLTGLDAGMLHNGIGIAIAVTLLVMAFRNKHFLGHANHAISGILIGLIVVAAWYVTGGPLGQEAIEAAEWMDEVPAGVGVQSYTFINPMGESLYYLMNGADKLFLTFGVVAVAGVIIGSLITAVITGKFKFVWFTSLADFVNHFAGATLMGIGGVLAMGCTIGQGISGVSTLSLGSFIALGSIIFGSALTMKIQYYKLMYDDEANFLSASLSSLVDMRLLPEGMRKLDPP
ncbi:hypothetical protein MNBD_GAMMA15-575 [hydrothermal vent metagenome]|uniref:Uncharacterized protein n=1 Tax=hydrothermal vent metagenome TaxID=652676 RepID=A0A3B0YW56_9ZZZZ